MRSEEQSQAPRPLEPRWLRTTGLTVVALFVGVPLLVLVLFVVVGLAPYIIAVIAWILLYRLVIRYDAAPYTYGRFASALLVAWALDAALFRGAVETLPALFRHFVPAIIVVSVFAGFYAWNTLPTSPAKRGVWPKSNYVASSAPHELGPAPQPVVVESHPFAAFASFMLMLFVMAYVVMPILTACIPSYASLWSIKSSTDNESPNGTAP